MNLWQIIYDSASNLIIIGTLFTIVIAQILKVLISSWKSKKLDLSYATSPSGMPSSHSAAVVTLSTLVGHFQGYNSTTFAVAVCFSLIIMYDAIGVRYQAGKHAEMLNQLLDKFTVYESEKEDKKHYLPIRLGHTFQEVLGGILTGFFVSFIVITFLS